MNVHQSELHRQECPLNAKQVQTVQLIANGKTAIDIAKVVGVTKFAIQKRIQTAKEILGVGKDTELVAVALRNGWIQ